MTFPPALAVPPSSGPASSLSVARVTLTGALGLYGPRIQVTAPRGRSELVGRLRSYVPYPTSRIRTTIAEAMPGADVVVREQPAQDKLERIYLVTVRLADGVPGGPRERVA